MRTLLNRPPWGFRARGPRPARAEPLPRAGKKTKKTVSVRRTASGSAKARGRIVVGARRHFLAHGFRGVTMDDLAAELGMSKKTFYVHFGTKDALLEGVLREKFGEVDRDLGEAIAGCERDFSGALNRILVCLQKHTEELRPAFVRDMRRTAPKVFARIQTRRQDIIERHFTKLLSAGQKLGLIRKDIPLRVAIEILLGATRAIVNPAKVTELNLTPQTAFQSILSVFLEGMVTAKSRARK